MQWDAHDGPVSSVFFSSDETAILSAGCDGRILRWSLHHLSRTICATSLTGHDGSSPVRLCPNGEGDHFLASSTSQGTAIMYRDESRGHKVVQRLFDHTSPILDLDWHPTLNVVASLAEDGTFCASKLVRRTWDHLTQ
jgi:WD40 repeat protein